MSFQGRNNSGALFNNDRKNNESQPDYKGTATINGVPVDIAAWAKESKGSGKKYLSLSFKLKESSDNQSPPISRKENNYQSSEDLPF